MMNVHAIAAASKRNESLHFGVADYSASTKSRTTNIGGPNKLYGVLTDKARFAVGDKLVEVLKNVGMDGINLSNLI